MGSESKAHEAVVAKLKSDHEVKMKDVQKKIAEGTKDTEFKVSEMKKQMASQMTNVTQLKSQLQESEAMVSSYETSNKDMEKRMKKLEVSAGNAADLQKEVMEIS